MSTVSQLPISFSLAGTSGCSPTLMEITKQDVPTDFEAIQDEEISEDTSPNERQVLTDTHTRLEPHRSPPEPVVAPEPPRPLTLFDLIAIGDKERVDDAANQAQILGFPVDFTARSASGNNAAHIAADSLKKATHMIEYLALKSGTKGLILFDARNNDGRSAGHEVVDQLRVLLTTLARASVPLDKITELLDEVSPRNPPPVHSLIGAFHACHFESRFKPCSGCAAICSSTQNTGITYYPPTTLSTAVNVGDLKISAVHAGNRQHLSWGTGDHQPRISLVDCDGAVLQSQLVMPPQSDEDAAAVYNSLRDDKQWGQASEATLAAVMGDTSFPSPAFSNSCPTGQIQVLRWVKGGALVGSIFVITKQWHTLPVTFAKLFVVPHGAGFKNGGDLFEKKTKPAAAHKKEVSAAATPMDISGASLAPATKGRKRKVEDTDTAVESPAKKPKKEGGRGVKMKTKPPPTASPYDGAGFMEYFTTGGVNPQEL